MSLPDFVRCLTLFEGVVAAVLTTATLWFFTRRHPPAGLVSHVARVTATHQAFVAYGLVEIILHFGDPFRWQLFAVMAVFTLAINAQIPLVRYEWKMTRYIPKEVNVDVAPT